MDYSGKTLVGAEVGKGYGLTDLDDKFPPSVRNLRQCEPPDYFPYKIK
jgi:hypothetical protein